VRVVALPVVLINELVRKQIVRSRAVHEVKVANTLRKGRYLMNRLLVAAAGSLMGVALIAVVGGGR
jgi:hypothetical protein